MSSNRFRRGFTLVEILLVIGIVALLTAVALPNYLKAQTRSKTSQAKSDLRTTAVALESYRLDSTAYPYDGYFAYGAPPSGYNFWYLPRNLSTPIAYLPSVDTRDPFNVRSLEGSIPDAWQLRSYRYTNTRSTWGTEWSGFTGRTIPSTYLPALLAEYGSWRLSSVAPDGTFGPNGWAGVATKPPYSYPAASLPLPYDPSNGTASPGDIIRAPSTQPEYLSGRL